MYLSKVSWCAAIGSGFVQKCFVVSFFILDFGGELFRCGGGSSRDFAGVFWDFGGEWE